MLGSSEPHYVSQAGRRSCLQLPRQCFYVVNVPDAAKLAAAQPPAEHSAAFLAQPPKEGNVSYKKLLPAHQKTFDKARDKEGGSLVGASAVRVMDPIES